VGMRLPHITRVVIDGVKVWHADRNKAADDRERDIGGSASGCWCYRESLSQGRTRARARQALAPGGGPRQRGSRWCTWRGRAVNPPFQFLALGPTPSCSPLPSGFSCRRGKRSTPGEAPTIPSFFGSPHQDRRRPPTGQVGRPGVAILFVCPRGKASTLGVWTARLSHQGAPPRIYSGLGPPRHSHGRCSTEHRSACPLAAHPGPAP